MNAATSGEKKKNIAKKNHVNAQIAAAEEVDPARGKPSSFFVMSPVNLKIKADPKYNPL